VNGHNLGRFWNIGPHQTLYCPAPWLKAGSNEVIVFEENGADRPVIAGLPEPILNKVNEQPTARKNRLAGETLSLAGRAPSFEGQFAPGKDWQTVRFPAVRGRYVCLEALTSNNADAFTTCAELYLLDAQGKDPSRDAWKVAYADSEELEGDDGRAENVFDLQFTTVWHTEWQAAQPKHPHQLVLDLGAVQSIAGLRYLPRQDSANGRIGAFRLYIAEKLFDGLKPR
jgi:beta-galactosidase